MSWCSLLSVCHVLLQRDLIKGASTGNCEYLGSLLTPTTNYTVYTPKQTSSVTIIVYRICTVYRGLLFPVTGRSFGDINMLSYHTHKEECTGPLIIKPKGLSYIFLLFHFDLPWERRREGGGWRGMDREGGCCCSPSPSSKPE